MRLARLVAYTCTLLALCGMLAGCTGGATTPPVTVTATETASVSVEVTETTTQTVTTTPTTSAAGLAGVSGTDTHGFVGTPARCDEADVVLVAMRTRSSENPPTSTGSVVVICRDSAGAFYYRGARNRAGDPGLQVSDVIKAVNAYVATNHHGGVKYTYAVSDTGLAIGRGDYNDIISDEPALEYYER